MKKTYLIGGGITLLATAILVGCNKNDHDQPAPQTPTTTVTVTPSLGKITNAKVILRNAKTGTILGSGNTGSKGVATFTAKVSSTPAVIEVQGSDGAQGATYFDEATNSNRPLPATQIIRAVTPNVGNSPNFGVTVLTELAYQSAVKAAGSETAIVDASIATQANEQIRNLLAKELGTLSLLTPPTLIGADTVVKDAITARTAANDYALKLAALAKLGTGENPVLSVLQKLSDDISDGNLNGKKGDISVGYHTGDTTDLSLALQNALAAYANATQINTIYTSTILNSFQVIQGQIKINITLGGGTGEGCVISASGAGVPPGFKVCYKNFPGDAICNASNPALSGINSVVIPGSTGQVSFTFSRGSCEGSFVTFDYAPGQ